MNLATFADRNLAEYGEYDRLVFEGKTYTNRELHERSTRLATALGRLGLVPGDKVVVLLPNCPEVLITFPAVWRAGMTAIPVLFLLEAHELRYILENSEARAIVTSPELLHKVESALAELGRQVEVIVAGPDAPPAYHGFDALVAGSEPLAEAVPREKTDLATLLYTSGTTGKPKGVMQTHGNLHANAMNAWNTATNRERNETTLLVLPLAHTFGLSVVISGYLFGGKAVLMRWFDPEGALALIQEHRVKGMAGVPTMFVYMLAHPNASRYDTSSVTRWLVGAAPMPTERLRAFEAKFGGTMYVGYGLTESCPGIAVEREGLPRKPGSTGPIMEGVEAKIVDDDARELPRGQVGEIIARGENVSPGYYRNPEATKEAFRDGWLFTGDVGYLDEDGYLFIVERKKDLIIRGGLNVYPKDVEEVLYRHPAVQEAAVVGVPDTNMGEEVCAYVVKKSGAEVTAEELIGHSQASLAKYKTPRWVEFVSAMPKTTIGKIQKKELRRLAREKFAR
ncbi:MAG TPA: long-chain fatty acid--CoA ligase [Polyangiaceae bacterium]|nr:long-chain fatty acid--CoA ligase [Polyangiaceae bacterium]